MALYYPPEGWVVSIDVSLVAIDASIIAIGALVVDNDISLFLALMGGGDDSLVAINRSLVSEIVDVLFVLIVIDAPAVSIVYVPVIELIASIGSSSSIEIMSTLGLAMAAMGDS